MYLLNKDAIQAVYHTYQDIQGMEMNGFDSYLAVVEIYFLLGHI